jgi:PII-like signaling protein
LNRGIADNSPYLTQVGDGMQKAVEALSSRGHAMVVHACAQAVADCAATRHPEGLREMTVRSPARKLTIIVGGTHLWHHRPLYVEIVHRAHAAGLAGASVFEGVEGFGASNHIHVAKFFQVSRDLPMMIVIIDTPERIEAFLPTLGELIDTGLVTIEDVAGIQPGARAFVASA